MLKIGFSGRKGTGKTTLAWELRDNLIERGLGTYVRSFATPMKLMINKLLAHVGADSLVFLDEAKDLPLPFLSGVTPRRLLQTLGTEWGRHCIGDRFWLSVEELALRHDCPPGTTQPDVVIYDDVRFDNEARHIVNSRGVVFTLEEQADDEGAEKDNHFSELGLSPAIRQVRVASKSASARKMADDLEAWLDAGGYLPAQSAGGAKS